MVLRTASGYIHFEAHQMNHLRHEQGCRSVGLAYEIYVDGRIHTFLISSALR